MITWCANQHAHRFNVIDVGTVKTSQKVNSNKEIKEDREH